MNELEEVKREQESTHIEIIRSLGELEQAIDKFESVLADFRGEASAIEKEQSARIDPPVGEVWTLTSPSIDKITKSLYEKIGQLEQMFS